MLLPTYISFSSLLPESSSGVYPSMQPNDFVFGSHTPVPSHNGPDTSRETITQVGAGHRATAARLGKRGSSMDSTASELGGMNVIDDALISAPPSKRIRKELPSGRVQGACTRCKRLKVIIARVLLVGSWRLRGGADEVHLRR